MKQFSHAVINTEMKMYALWWYIRCSKRLQQVPEVESAHTQVLWGHGLEVLCREPDECVHEAV